MSYNVGDKVRIISQLHGGNIKIGFKFKGMEECCGKIATIQKKILSYGARTNFYMIDLDQGRFVWLDKFFEPAEINFDVAECPDLEFSEGDLENLFGI